MILACKDLNKAYHSATETVYAIRDLNLEVPEGSFSLIYGPSGSGKSTLLNLIAGIDRPESGEIRFLGRELSGLRDRERTRIRRESLGLIFQGFELIPVMSCYENIEYPLLLQGLGAQERKARIGDLAEKLGISQLLHRKPGNISGGQKQRVAIARTLVAKPKLVLGDEITGNLDSTTTRMVLEVLGELRREEGMTFLLVTHDQELRSYGSAVHHLRDGRLQGEAQS